VQNGIEELIYAVETIRTQAASSLHAVLLGSFQVTLYVPGGIIRSYKLHGRITFLQVKRKVNDAFKIFVQAGWGQCGQSWMQGFCAQSCGRCSAPPSGCTDTPPDNQYTCAQQVLTHPYVTPGSLRSPSWWLFFCRRASCSRRMFVRVLVPGMDLVIRVRHRMRWLALTWYLTELQTCRVVGPDDIHMISSDLFEDSLCGVAGRLWPVWPVVDARILRSELRPVFFILLGLSPTRQRLHLRPAGEIFLFLPSTMQCWTCQCG
jgi:hypothetical protein